MPRADREEDVHRSPHDRHVLGNRAVGLVPADDRFNRVTFARRVAPRHSTRHVNARRDVVEKLSQFDQAWVVIARPDDHLLRISRASFSTAYFDGRKLRVLTEGGHQAYKGDVEGKKDKVAEAFTSRGYRWGEI